MKSILLSGLTFILTSTAFANSFVCEMVDKEASRLLIEYDNNTAETIYLQSPGSDQWRPIDLKVEPIIGGAFDNLELLGVKPKEIENIEWNNLPECYVEIGTQWFFTFNRKKESYTVQLMPYHQKKNETCMTPQYKPQTHKLKCNWSE